MTIEERRKYDRERKQLERRLHTPYAERVRANKRSEAYKAKRRIQRKKHAAKEAAYARMFRHRPEQIIKNRARTLARSAIVDGRIVRSSSCELCGKPDVKRSDGKSSLRADHYAGYDNPLTVRFVCCTCDGTQERQRNNTTILKCTA